MSLISTVLSLIRARILNFHKFTAPEEIMKMLSDCDREAESDFDEADSDYQFEFDETTIEVDATIDEISEYRDLVESIQLQGKFITFIVNIHYRTSDLQLPRFLSVQMHRFDSFRKTNVILCGELCDLEKTAFQFRAV